MARLSLPLLLFFIISLDLTAQNHSSIETSAIISSSDSTPFWLQNNRHGMFARNGSQLFTRFQHHSSANESGFFTILYGADLIARPGSEATFSFNQGYLKIQAAGIEFAAGRFHNTSPIHDSEIGLGSLGISTNPSPIPQLRLGLVDWTSIPLTKDIIQIRGHVSHGWLGSRRYTDDLLLHEKVGHVRFGGKLPLNLYAGIAHYVKWGGDHPEFGNIPTRFSDFKDVFLAYPGDEQTPGPFQTYVLGDHLGAWDFGFFLNIGETSFTVYRQFPLESRDNLKLKSLQDALTGISVTLPDNFRLPVKRIVYEHLYTKYQDGPRRPNIGGDPDRDLYRGNENYYNHGVYRSGWVYNHRTIGNPLFIPSAENLGVINNRIVAHHAGVVSEYEGIQLSAKATYSRNYGKYCDNRVPNLGDEELFGYSCELDDLGDAIHTVGGHSVNQWSFLTSAEIPLHLLNEYKTVLLLEVAYDNGGLVGNQIGALLGLRWMP